MFLEVM